ncbi:periplasmic heavy metal sensor [Pigmentiphaga aceris]|uniref:Periplasmic heavy metal sensor n=1 Tax=Pigmentiphaga aceris TaxID=1940612 RepID=A0A5C0AVM9_9BURK|nr:Spy/CpxP family protein refolding chaperone [Pigmentiphaga aceris]QEI05756.1 periplasmic heavy metal sensor [Pigmentiphaga aceris]
MNTRRIGQFVLATVIAASTPLLVHAAPSPADAGPAASAHRGAPGHPGGPGGPGFEHRRGGGEFGRGPHFLHGIKLTEAQQDKVFEILHNRAPALRDAMKAAGKSRKELNELVRSGSFKESEGRALADRGAKAFAEAEFLKARSDAEIMALLTPEQRAEIKTRQERRQLAMRGEGRGQWGGNRSDAPPPAPGVAPATPATPAPTGTTR